MPRCRDIQVLCSLAFIILIVSCNTILGPPDSEMVVQGGHPITPFPYDTLAQGRPDLGLLMIEGGLSVWNQGKGWHVRVAKPLSATRGEPFNPVAEGRIWATEARIIHIQRHNITPGNFVHSSSHDIIFRFELRDAVEGFDFRLEPLGFEYCIFLDFQFNGIPSPEFVHLGRTMHIPNIVPVPICFR